MKFIKNAHPLLAIFAIVSVCALAGYGCASTSATVFNTTKTIADGARGATHAFNVYYHQATNGATSDAVQKLEAQRTALYDADRKLSASLNIVENLREAYDTNAAPDNLTALNIALQAATDQSSNIVALVQVFIAK